MSTTAFVSTRSLSRTFPASQSLSMPPLWTLQKQNACRNISSIYQATTTSPAISPKATSVLSSYPIIAPQKPKRIIVALTGATGTILGIRLLQRLRKLNVETHLIISKWAAATLKYETSYTLADVQSLASKIYSYKEQSASISSGSVVCGFEGMVIVPCSMKTLAGVRIGYADDLVSRAADVVLKERRKLVMVVRETPLSAIHLENMLSLTRIGAVMFPPVPAFYTRPETLDEVVEQSVGRILDCFGIETGEFDRWDGFGGPRTKERQRIEEDERTET